MRFKLLSSPLLIRDFVDGEENCNYEIYLLELLNHSTWFSCHFPGSFTKPKDESHGEYDANNPNYRLDFKLFASKTALHARSILAPQITKIRDGLTLTSTSKKQGTFKATYLHTAFRHNRLSDLEAIRYGKGKAAGIEDDIRYALKTLETEKNILLFFPCSFSFDQPHGYNEAINSITNGLQNDFASAFQYRSHHAGNYDTFFCCLYDNDFLLFKVVQENLVYLERISVTNLSTFLKLSGYSDW